MELLLCSPWRHPVLHTSDGHPFTFIDLFAGIGGFRFGLEPLGGRCVLTVERDKYARQTYERWHGEEQSASTFVEDIRDLDPVDVPDHDVLAAGFPCQPFSLAGVSKKNSLGREHGFQDPTQGTLFFDLKEIAKVKRPRVLLLENVKNLLSHDNKRTWGTIEKALKKIRYTAHVAVIDARYWVPQHRERVFIVAFDNDHVDPSIPFEFPPIPVAEKPVLGSILEAAVEEKYTVGAGTWECLKKHKAKHSRLGNGFGYSVVGPDDVARTMSARYHKDGAEILVRQERADGRPRRLTPLEAQRLMGFDEVSLGRELGSLNFEVSDTQAYRQFGNAVVPAVVNHVAAAALGHVQRLDTWIVAERAMKAA
jgi:DNA (cytosine-5)-methyltransferase 1